MDQVTNEVDLSNCMLNMNLNDKFNKRHPNAVKKQPKNLWDVSTTNKFNNLSDMVT